MESTQIITSPSDKRLYKHITLEGNGIQCLLISDPEADKSAASLDVKVGAALDPRPLFGTAHFLEHMLFMGTDKYPSENEYSEYITNNGGMNNAYTSLTDTNYHFDCSNEGFEGALDRFAQFFIAPILNEGSTDREMEAVDSEYNQSLQSDAWRFYSLLQAAVATEGSSLNRFGCGNKGSLKQEGIREALLKFHSDWYSSNIMKLCISGNHTIEKMEEWARSMFAPVPNKNVSVPNLAEPISPFKADNLGQILRFIPVKDKDVLTVFWLDLPYTQREYKSQPLKYFSHLFGHEGPNSLLSYLKREGLALALSSYDDHEIWAVSNF